MGARLVVVLCVASACFSFAAAAFWYEDARFSLPTPVPADLAPPTRGAPIDVDAWLTPLADSAENPADSRPVLLHFFNPGCACSRFNVPHLRALRRRFGQSVRFVGVAQTGMPDEDLAEAVRAIGLDLPWIVDRGGRVAAAAGVYSTPQAVLVDSNRRLAYRGNYNVSRYCTDPATEFVRVAIEALLSQSVAMPSDVPAYGCELPSRQP